jgi:hypothetical protein
MAHTNDVYGYDEPKVTEGNVFEPAPDARDFAVPLAGATKGCLQFTRGVSRLDLRADAALTDLCRARFEGPIPQVRAEGGAVSVRYPWFSPLGWLQLAASAGRHSAEITLNAGLPWEITIREGVSQLDADLTAVVLRSFEVRGGASHATLNLSKPSGTVSVRFGGGVSWLSIARPVGVPVRLRIGGGVSHLAVDEMHFGAIGGATDWQSPQYSEATNRYEISIGGGASHLTIDRP